jgi:DNA-binding PadR family transcriptional regulator
MSVKHALLGILADKPSHGYELKAQFEEKLGEFWELNFGQIYQSLDRLHKDGLVDFEDVEQSDKPDKKIYRLTNAGRVEFEAWRNHPVKAEPRSLRDELFLKLMFLKPEDSGRILPVLQNHQTVYMAHMMQLSNRKYALEEQFQRQMEVANTEIERQAIEQEKVISTLLIDVALYHAEADIRWLRHCEAKIKSLI